MPEFVDLAAREMGVKIRWVGGGVDKRGLDLSGNGVVAADPRYFQPTEVETLLGDASKAREKLGWRLRTSFAELASEMVQEDLKGAGAKSYSSLAVSPPSPARTSQPDCTGLTA